MTSHLTTNYLRQHKKNIKSPFRNVVKSTLAMERLKPATELKLKQQQNIQFAAFRKYL